MTLQELARTKGKSLGQIGLCKAQACAYSTGYRRPSPRSIATMATTLGVAPDVVTAACDAAYQARHAAHPVGAA